MDVDSLTKRTMEAIQTLKDLQNARCSDTPGIVETSFSEETSQQVGVKRRQDAKQYKCAKCGRCYGWKYSLTRHNCKPKKPSVCPHCGKDFKYPCYLKKHKCQASAHSQCQIFHHPYGSISPTVNQQIRHQTTSELNLCFDGRPDHQNSDHLGTYKLEKTAKTICDLTYPQKSQKRSSQSPRHNIHSTESAPRKRIKTSHETNLISDSSITALHQELKNESEFCGYSMSGSTPNTAASLTTTGLVLRPFNGGIIVNSIPSFSPIADPGLVLSTAQVMGGNQFWINSSPSTPSFISIPTASSFSTGGVCSPMACSP